MKRSARLKEGFFSPRHFESYSSFDICKKNCAYKTADTLQGKMHSFVVGKKTLSVKKSMKRKMLIWKKSLGKSIWRPGWYSTHAHRPPPPIRIEFPSTDSLVFSEKTLALDTIFLSLSPFLHPSIPVPFRSFRPCFRSGIKNPPEPNPNPGLSFSFHSEKTQKLFFPP